MGRLSFLIFQKHRASKSFLEACKVHGVLDLPAAILGSPLTYSIPDA